MSVIGKFEEYIDDEQRCFLGIIVAYDKEIRIRLVPSGSDHPKAPTHTILKVGKSYEPQIGSGWLKHPKKVGSKIAEFLSLTIDDSDFPNPLNVAAFPKGNGEWDISWRRQNVA